MKSHRKVKSFVVFRTPLNYICDFRTCLIMSCRALYLHSNTAGIYSTVKHPSIIPRYLNASGNRSFERASQSLHGSIYVSKLYGGTKGLIQISGRIYRTLIELILLCTSTKTAGINSTIKHPGIITRYLNASGSRPFERAPQSLDGSLSTCINFMEAQRV